MGSSSREEIVEVFDARRSRLQTRPGFDLMTMNDLERLIDIAEANAVTIRSAQGGDLDLGFMTNLCVLEKSQK
jgi:hypothetical protein